MPTRRQSRQIVQLTLFAAIFGMAALPRNVDAADIGFVETFAWAEDREAVLKQLIPGTEDYYYYHCLHLQNSQRLEQSKSMLEAWGKRHDRTPRWQVMWNRQNMLAYGTTPKSTLDHLTQALNLRFDHQRERIGEKPNLPNELDAQRIARATLEKRARAQANLAGFEASALEWLMDSNLNALERRRLLSRLTLPDHPKLASLIAEDLKTRDSGGFGSMAIHQKLTIDQLDQLVKLQPSLQNDSNLVAAYVAKLRPTNDEDWKNNAGVQQAYLERLWSFVSQLGPVHNSRKAHALYHRLDFDRAHGVYDKQRFLEYLRLPRNTPYINRQLIEKEENRRFVANLEQSFAETKLPPIGPTDQSLIRDYFLHFFQQEANYDLYLPLVSTEHLKSLFAEAKAVNGLGNPEQWASLLSPAAYQALKDRIDLDFDVENKKVFRSDERVALDVHVKNVQKLIVKVFYINTESHARQTLQDVNTDIQLDGLVANQEQTKQYDEPALRRIKRHFEFPELTKPGVYVIDFIGSGRASRAVIRKGSIRQVVRTTPIGQLVTVLDENREIAKDAMIWSGGAEYKPNAKGHILLPFSTEGAKTAAHVIHHQGQAFVERFVSMPERFALEAAFVLNREQLQTRQQASVLIKPQVTINGVPTTVSRLQDIELTILATDLDGVSTQSHASDITLSDTEETVHTFQVPSRLASLNFVLSAKIKQATKGSALQSLSASSSFSLNQIETTQQIADTHLAWIDNEYIVQLLGRTGEPLADRAVHVELKHRDFTQTIHSDLQTDAMGAVRLGRLDDIVWLKARCTSTTYETNARLWRLNHNLAAVPAAVHLCVGDRAELPALGIEDLSRQEVALLEIREGRIVADRFKHLRRERGMLVLEDLPAGDYQLALKSTGHTVTVRVTKGDKQTGFGLGDIRQLELDAPRIGLSDVKTNDETIELTLTNSPAVTRVHVLSSRYMPPFSAFNAISRLPGVQPAHATAFSRRSLYAEDRSIGDEYDYILRRQAAARFPGNMLDRPSVLLNPWALRSTDTSSQSAKDGSNFDAMPEEPNAPAESPPHHGGSQQTDANTDFATLNWLDASAVLANLSVDKNGVCSIPRKLLNGGQHVRILIVAGEETLQKSLSLKSQTVTLRDLRLAAGLPPNSHLIQQKQVAAIEKGKTFTLRSVDSARYESIDSLGDVFQLYETLRPDPKFSAFRFILRWPQLSDEEKRAKYSEFASHELNFFLLHKDSKFFDQVVAPYLFSKRDKTFIDHFLTDADLLPYLDPWRHAQLNTAERILIGHRIQNERAAAKRHVEDLVATLAPDADRWTHLFDTAVKRSSLTLDVDSDRVTYSRLAAESARTTAAPSPANRPAAPGAPPPPAADPSGNTASNKEEWASLARRSGQADKAKNASVDALAAQLDGNLDMRRKNLGRMPQLQRGQAGGQAMNGAALGLDYDDAGIDPLYVKLETTSEYAENNYYHLPIQDQNSQLIQPNRFWQDYASHQEGPFVSPHLAEASRTFTESMMALAVLDLPWKAEKHDVKFDERDMQVTAGSPIIFFHEEIREPAEANEQGAILVNQNLFRLNDRYRQVNNQRVDKYVTDEFLTHTVYGCQIVVTNPTSAPQKLNLLTQIPEGALPLGRGKVTQNTHVDLAPFHTQTIEFYFYFPQVGKYPMFPVHIAAGGVLMASAPSRVLNVVESLSRIDRDSWVYVSQNGEANEVLNYLEKHNLQQLNLEKIAFRMGDPEFFETVTGLLVKRHVYSRTLWSYAVRHDNAERIRQFLRHEDSFLAACGPYLESPLLTIDPVERKSYQHLAYKPLVNARAHQLGAARTILNDRLHAQYHAMLNIHSCRPELDDDDRMSATYYLLLQDRVAEGLQMFNKVNAKGLATKIQYDYFQAYTSFYTGERENAGRIVEQYKVYPVDRWRETFAAVGAQLREIQGGATEVIDEQNRDQRQAELASRSPSFDFKVEAGKVVLNYQNLEEATIRYYLMDIELLFSRNPFVKQFSGRFSHIRPNEQQTITFEKTAGSYEFKLPKSLDNKNVLIEITAGGVAKTDAYYSNALNLHVSERFGQLRTTDAKGTPLPKCYVKVFARMNSGVVKFYKDGYTDLRGRFDYASLSSNELDQVNQFSLLIMSDSHGATVREAGTPSR